MIENRNEYQGHISHQDLNMNFRRQNVFHSIMKKDVQVYQDSNQQSQMLDQMKIPLSADDNIQILDWLDMIFNDFGIPLRQAQYINIWDPVEGHYVNITGYRVIPAQNFKQASPIYIRYLPFQEQAVPPHANYQSMMEENNTFYNPIYQQNSQGQSCINYYQQNGQTQVSSNQYNLFKSTNSKSNDTQVMNGYPLNHMNTNQDMKCTTSFAGKNQRESVEQQNFSILQNNSNIISSNFNHKNPQNFAISNRMSMDNDVQGRNIIQLKQEASSPSIEQDVSKQNNLKIKMEDSENFASTQQINNQSGSFHVNLKKEDRERNGYEDMNDTEQVNNCGNGNGKAQNIKQKVKDCDQLQQKDTCHSSKQSEQQSKGHKQLPREKRVKERQISYVKGKVDEWRNLYDKGHVHPNGQLEKVNLDVAASLVGLSRKTLDDYYAQLRKAQRYAFDFESNASEKMGTLRKYVKKMSEKDINAGEDDSVDTDNNTSSKSNFNTPQLKPSISSDIKQELSMSVGYHSTNSRRYSENNHDASQVPLHLKQHYSTPQQTSQINSTLLSQVKVENLIYNNNTSNQSHQKQQQLKQSSLQLFSYDQSTIQHKTENHQIKNHLINNAMNFENIQNNNVEPMEEEVDDFIDYINSENNNNNQKQEQNDDQYN